jgi:hypothetical protein
MLGVKQLFDSLDSDIFYYIHILTVAIVAMPRIAISILISEKRALSLKHGSTDIVLGGDKIYCFPLPLPLLMNNIIDFWVGLA